LALGGNIGNAKIEGLQEDLNLTDSQYNWCLTVFFFTYSAFEVPSNLMLKHMRPSIWLPIIMVSWGVVMTLMGLVRNFQGLLAARIFLGVTEAGLFPGVAYYLTNWYRREEMQLRQAMFFSAASVAGAFSGLLAYGIGKMDGLAGLHGWQWIFILEGLVTVVVALGAFWMMYDFPDTAEFLSQEERDFVVWRLKFQHNGHGAQVAQEDGFKWKYARDAFLDWQVWLNIILFWSVSCRSEVNPLSGLLQR
jgi:MFS family permease